MYVDHVNCWEVLTDRVRCWPLEQFGKDFSSKPEIGGIL